MNIQSEAHSGEAQSPAPGGDAVVVTAVDNTGERRRQHRASSNKTAFLQQLKQEYFYDILRARSHSRHFRHTRAQTISNRVRTLAFLLGVLIPAWITIDTLYLSGSELFFISLLRLATGGALLGLAFWRSESHSLHLSRVKLAALVLISSLFHTVAHLYLNASGTGIPPGYHFFPFMIITLGAIFPLTIMEGGWLALFITATHLGTAAYEGELTTLQTLNDIWLLVLLALITGWAALTQLTMMMRLYRQAHRDPLTGLANRRSIVAYLEREVLHSREHDVALSLMLLDLDKFKRINDTHGHAAGDEVLKTFASLLVSQSREEDLVGRYGGEEFLMILSGTPKSGAHQIAERLRSACHQQRVIIPAGEALQFTTSIGVAELNQDESIEQMLKRVDDALYAAKGGGRDRVVIA
ncbi:GGDEF domain-containing protein [Motiliproteus sediminis]|uniref:GGDEF domain-containing protein n=1 Tax=Motiliproteus sediminis TaxID=1468178 RepID=UPI001AEF708D|nr:GGDEF domain-containing protein [Motiliproteus sediminis]